MTEKLVFWAQALDNTSPDHIDLQGEQLSPEDTVPRQEAVSLVSNVVKAGRRIFSNGGVQLTADGRRFVVEVPSAQHDHAGRKAPIVCCGEYDASVDDTFGASIAVAIEDFARRIGRTIRREHSETTRRAFSVLKKKSSAKRLMGVVRIGVLALAVLALVYVLARRGP